MALKDIQHKIRSGEYNFSDHAVSPPSVVIITVYEPDPKEWVDCKIRR